MKIKYNYNNLYLFVSLILISSCASLPSGNFTNNSKSIDYSNVDRWAAHPNKKDLSDSVPAPIAALDYKIADVDIFYLHPTTFTSSASQGEWNADINDTKLNQRTDKLPIKLQASIFNQVGSVYAPRYRQAHIHTYFEKDEQKTKQIFDLAYSDIKKSFEYYLKHYNQGRPIIIASHSQGTSHAIRLIEDYFDNKELKKQLICAYLIGMPVLKNNFQSINTCEDATDTNCFVSWRTYREGYTSEFDIGDSISVTNPLNWNSKPQLVGQEYHKGAILRNFDKVIPKIVEARIYNGMLWTNKPKFPMSFLFTRKDYHIADLNFFYVNIQENARERTEAFLNSGINKG